MRTLLCIVALSALIVLTVVFSFKNEPAMPVPTACTMDAKICPDGTAVGRTGPQCEFEACPTKEVPITPPDDILIIDAPTTNQTITSPVTVSGKARGTWFFEGSFPITIVNWDGLIIGEGYATAQGDWMTTEFVPFMGTVSYTIPPETPYDRGFIILKKDNPSGLPEYDDAREFQILFSEISPK